MHMQLVRQTDRTLTDFESWACLSVQPGFKTRSARNLAVKLVHSVALRVWLANSAVADSQLTKEILLFMSHGSAQERPSKL